MSVLYQNRVAHYFYTSKSSWRLQWWICILQYREKARDHNIIIIIVVNII